MEGYGFVFSYGVFVVLNEGGIFEFDVFDIIFVYIVIVKLFVFFSFFFYEEFFYMVNGDFGFLYVGEYVIDLIQGNVQKYEQCNGGESDGWVKWFFFDDGVDEERLEGDQYGY